MSISFARRVEIRCKDGDSLRVRYSDEGIFSMFIGHRQWGMELMHVL